MADPELRRTLLEFEIALAAGVADEVRTEDWGRTFLSPSLPLVWDASYIALERAGIGMADVETLADQVLGAAGFAHRTVVVVDEADGRRLAEEAETVADWEAERTRYMVWSGGEPSAPPNPTGVRTDPPISRKTANASEVVGALAAPRAQEVSLATAAPLRRALQAELTPAGEDDPAATAEQLLERERRLGEAGGNRWFVAPDDGTGASACCLFRDGHGTGQVENVATLESARGRGLANAVVRAAGEASRRSGDTTTFITADAADWPQFFYEKLGFIPVGDLHTLRRRPGAEDSEGH